VSFGNRPDVAAVSAVPPLTIPIKRSLAGSWATRM
jgi:hypothetical protein